jgi:hypothetical protein
MLLFAVLAAAHAQDLDIAGTCPGPVDVFASNLTPGGQVALLTGRGPGADVIPAGPCAGRNSDLGGITFRGLFSADANGELLLTPTLSGAVCGASVQMLDVATCSLTNLDAIPQPALSYAVDIEPFLQPTCGGCHGGSGGFTLSYNNLLANSLDIPTMPRISPFDPANSYAWLKMEGTHRLAGGAGNQMPPGGALPTAELDLIEQWILDGALP